MPLGPTHRPADRWAGNIGPATLGSDVGPVKLSIPAMGSQEASDRANPWVTPIRPWVEALRSPESEEQKATQTFARTGAHRLHNLLRTSHVDLPCFALPVRRVFRGPPRGSVVETSLERRFGRGADRMGVGCLFIP